MNLFTKQKTQNFENKLMIIKEERFQEGINYKVGINICAYYT